MILEILEPITARKGNRALCVCDYCQKEFITKFSEARDSKHNFCSSDCSNKYHVLKNASNWVDGSDCYRGLLNLKKDFNTIVHHRDGNRRNNELNNLEIMTRREHNLIHNPPMGV